MTPRKKPDERLSPRQVRMGRTGVRDLPILFRVSEQERELLEAAASEDGMPLASWCRHQTLKAAEPKQLRDAVKRARHDGRPFPSSPT